MDDYLELFDTLIICDYFQTYLIKSIKILQYIALRRFNKMLICNYLKELH